MTDLDIPLTGRFQPPLENGEVVFEAPWQGRVFGIAVRLAEQGTVDWSDFQGSLIEVVGEWDREHANTNEEYPYFELFAEALSRLLVAKGFVGELELTDRDEALAARPHGHDH